MLAKDKISKVDVHTVDMTAIYGEDHQLNEKDVENLKARRLEKMKILLTA